VSGLLVKYFSFKELLKYLAEINHFGNMAHCCVLVCCSKRV